jgi:hypothetical protein
MHAQPGLHATYDGDVPAQPEPGELCQLRRRDLPALPPALFGANSRCGCCRTRQQVVGKYGAVHGQRCRGAGGLVIACCVDDSVLPCALQGVAGWLAAVPTTSLCGTCCPLHVRVAHTHDTRLHACVATPPTARVRLSSNDKQALGPQLGGSWDVELVCNDNLENMWVVWRMARSSSSSSIGGGGSSVHACRSGAHVGA